MERNRVFSVVGLRHLRLRLHHPDHRRRALLRPRPRRLSRSGTHRGDRRCPTAPLVVWDGDKNANGKGWASCGKKDGCTTSIEPAAGAGTMGQD